MYKPHSDRIKTTNIHCAPVSFNIRMWSARDKSPLGGATDLK